MRSPRRLMMALVAVLLVACSSGSEGGDVADFGVAPPTADGQQVPADEGLDVADAPVPGDVPPRDATLFPGGWPEAAAFIAREADAGRPTLVNIFASWCAPCEREMPLLLETAAANTDVAFLGIDHQDRLEDGEAFVEDLGIDIPTIFDTDGDVAFAVGGRVMPTTVMFDADGRLTGRVLGELTESSIEQLLDSAR